MKYIWIVMYGLIWFYVICDAIQSIRNNKGYFEIWFSDMSAFSFAWVIVNAIVLGAASFLMWLM